MFDDLLTAVLLIAVPGYNLWRSLARRNRPPEPRIHTYRRGIFLAAVLAALLAADWGMAGRSPALLGLGWPPATPGLIGLALAALLLVTAAVVVRSAKANPKAADAGAAMLPQTPSERRLFLIMVAVLGVAWEALYRGYLIWALQPRMGLPLAIAAAATAYGLAHGYKSARQLGGSLVSAVLFTLGFALTHSLWWLIALHAGLPMVGVLMQRAGGGPAPTPVPTEQPAESG